MPEILFSISNFTSNDVFHHFSFPACKYDDLENESLYKYNWWVFMCQNVNIDYCLYLVPKFGNVRDRQNWQLYATVDICMILLRENFEILHVG